MGIERQGLAKSQQRLGETFLSGRTPVITAFQIKLIGLHVIGAALVQQVPLFLCEPVDDGLRQLFRE